LCWSAWTTSQGLGLPSSPAIAASTTSPWLTPPTGGPSRRPLAALRSRPRCRSRTARARRGNARPPRPTSAWERRVSWRPPVVGVADRRGSSREVWPCRLSSCVDRKIGDAVNRVCTAVYHGSSSRPARRQRGRHGSRRYCNPLCGPSAAGRNDDQGPADHA